MKFVALIFAVVCISSLWGTSDANDFNEEQQKELSALADATETMRNIFLANMDMKLQRWKSLQYQAE